MPLIKSQPILHACSCWKKSFPPGKEDKLRPEVLLYIPYKKYCNICPNTHDILKRLPWVGVFNKGFLSRVTQDKSIQHHQFWALRLRFKQDAPALYKTHQPSTKRTGRLQNAPAVYKTHLLSTKRTCLKQNAHYLYTKSGCYAPDSIKTPLININ